CRGSPTASGTKTYSMKSTSSSRFQSALPGPSSGRLPFVVSLLNHRLHLLAIVTTMLAACSPVQSPASSSPAVSVTGAIQRTLVLGGAGEPATAAAKGLQTAGLTGIPRDPFNAG